MVADDMNVEYKCDSAVTAMTDRTAVIFIGIQGSGKTTFYRERLADRYEHISLDVLNTHNKEMLAMMSCFDRGASFVVDNTDVTREERARYIVPAREHGWRVVGYYFRSSIAECAERNDQRTGKKRLPRHAIAATAKKLEPPSRAEGFDELFYVRIEDGEFIVSEWRDEDEV